MIEISAYSLAQRFVGLHEVSGPVANAQILAMLQLEDSNIHDDEIAWCSAFVNYIAWLLRLPRSKSLAARSWLQVGTPIQLTDAEADADVVILQRGDGPQPGVEVISAPGHVGFYSGLEGGNVLLLGGNQGDRVSVAPFPTQRILGVRRLA